VPALLDVCSVLPAARPSHNAERDDISAKNREFRSGSSSQARYLETEADDVVTVPPV